MVYGAVILPMVKANVDIPEPNVVLGKQAQHIVTVKRPAESSCIVVSLSDILKVCSI